MKNIIKTYKNFEDFNEDDIVTIYDRKGNIIECYNSSLKELRFDFFCTRDLEADFKDNCLEVVSQAPRKKLTKEYLLDRKLSEFPLKVWGKSIHVGYFHIVSIIFSFEGNLIINYKGSCGGGVIELSSDTDLYLDPPSKELIEVKVPWAVEEPKKILRLKDVKRDRRYKVYMKGICKTDILEGSIMLSVCSDGAIDILEEIIPKWFVKSIKDIKEVSGEYTLEELRKLYPNCLYKRTEESDWVE